ncbi:hypothetical protein ACJP3X_002632 [Staphylococcus aureus]
MDNKIKNIFETLINFWNEHNQTISILAAAFIPIMIPIVVFYITRLRTNKIIEIIIQKDKNELKKYLLHLENVEDLKENHNDVIKMNSNVNYITTFLQTKINKIKIKEALTETLKNYESTLTKTLDNHHKYLSKNNKDKLSKRISHANHAIEILANLDINTNIEFFIIRDVKAINKNTQNIKELKRILLILTRN